MEIENLKTISDDLGKYNIYNKGESHYISITEWPNGEGWYIDIDGKIMPLTYGELDAINYLTKALEYADSSNK